MTRDYHKGHGSNNHQNLNLVNNTSEKPKNNNNSFESLTDVLNKSHTLRDKLMNQISEIYKTNPEKLYNDLGPHEFNAVILKYNIK
jgi:hypothetical protein